MSQLPDSIRQYRDEPVIVDTTLDLDLERAAERALNVGLIKDGRKLNAQPGRAGGDDAGRRDARPGRRPLV